MTNILPTVSVVIPTFNRAETLRRAVDTAFSQEGVEVEVIVVDDGSTDNTAILLEELQALRGAKLRVIRQSNSGASAARNAGIDAARYTYVQFLDSDDTLEVDKLRRQCDVYQSEPNVSVVLCYGWLETSMGEERIGLDLGTFPQLYLEEMCGRKVHVVQTSAPLWRRTFLVEQHRWNTSISLGDDLEFHARCFSDLEEIAFVHDALFTVRDHAGDRLSDFSHDSSRLASLLKTREEIYEALATRGFWTKKCSEQMAEALRSIFVVYLMRMSSEEIASFEDAAERMCGRCWKGKALDLMTALRRTAGPSAVEKFYDTVQQARSVGPRLSPAAWNARGKRLVARLSGEPAKNIENSRIAAASLRKAVPREPSALFIELNAFHTETIPGYASLLSQAGYNVTVLHRIGSDVTGAVARLPASSRPKLVPLTLRDMKQVVSGGLPGRYDLVMIGSGTLSERNGYFGGSLDYLGCIPEGRVGHIVIEHAVLTLQQRKDRFRSDHLFGLRQMQAGDLTLPMLAPVDFGPSVPAKLSSPVKMAVIGRLDPEMRDVAGLYEAVRNQMQQDGPDFEVQLIGGAGLEDVPEDIRPVFQSLGRLPFKAMYDAIEQAHVLLTLLDSRDALHRRYLYGNTTGTRQLSLGFATPMVMDAVFASAYGFGENAAIVHQPGDLETGLKQARSLSQETLTSMQQTLGTMKGEVMKQSLTNLQRFMAGNGAII